jgi:hypothetical protein
MSSLSMRRGGLHTSSPKGGTEKRVESPHTAFEVIAMQRCRVGGRYTAIRNHWRLWPVFWLLLLAADPAGAEFKLLDLLEDTRIERIDRFVAAEAFETGTKIGGRTLSAVGLNFVQHSLGVVEKNVPAVSLRRWVLRYTTGDKSLVKALGGEQEAALSFLAYIHRLMEMGEAGAGHTDWRSNIAYLRSPIVKRLWAVHWTVNYANEWTIGAVYVPHPELDWRSGPRLFGNGREPQALVRRSQVNHEP